MMDLAWMPGLEDEGHAAAPRTSPWSWRLALRAVAALGLGILACAALVWASGYRYRPLDSLGQQFAQAPPPGTGGRALTLEEARAHNRRLRAALARLAPRGTYIIVDQTHNRLYLARGERVIHEAVCSAGSGYVLREHGGRREWVFDTPRGLFHVRQKLKNPVWRKPDWAFVEEGLPIPSDPDERIEYGVLGEYALYLEDGYMIHGTLYERLLGRPVTHGCIRLGREDLRLVWNSVEPGAAVYIF